MFFLILYLINFKTEIKSTNVLLGIILGTLVGIKSHVWMITMSAIFSIGLINALRKHYSILLTGVVGLLISLIYLSFSVSGPSALLIYPFWFISSMYQSSDRVNTPTWELARQFLISINSVKGIIRLYLEGLFMFHLINLGPFLLGVLLSIKSKLKNQSVNYLLLVSFFSIVFTHTFIYRWGTIVTIQFFYLSVFSLAVLSSLLIVKLWYKSKYFSAIILTSVWISLLPGVYWNLAQYKLQAHSSNVNPEIMDVISVLAREPYGTYLMDPNLIPGSVLQAYTNKSAYVGYDITLDGFGINKQDRINDLNTFFSCKDEKILWTKIKADYIIAPSGWRCVNYTNLTEVKVNNKYTIIKQKNIIDI